MSWVLALDTWHRMTQRNKDFVWDVRLRKPCTIYGLASTLLDAHAFRPWRSVGASTKEPGSCA